METPPRTTRDPFRGSLAVDLDLITSDRLAGPDFLRLHADTYVGAEADVDTRLRVRALSTWSGDRGIVAGPLAALAYGADCPWDDAEIVLARHRRPPDGVTARRYELPDSEIATRFGCPLTTSVRTAFDLARRSPLAEAVAAVDSIAHVTRFTADRLRRLVERHPGARGLAQAREVFALMDPRAESLPETRLRLGLAEIPQFGLTLLTGEHVRLDLAWPHARFALEYDGPEHRSISGQNRDAFRSARIGDLGWTIGTVTSAMVLDPEAFDELAARVLRRVL